MVKSSSLAVRVYGPVVIVLGTLLVVLAAVLRTGLVEAGAQLPTATLIALALAIANRQKSYAPGEEFGYCTGLTFVFVGAVILHPVWLLPLLAIAALAARAHDPAPWHVQTITHGASFASGAFASVVAAVSGLAGGTFVSAPLPGLLLSGATFLVVQAGILSGYAWLNHTRVWGKGGLLTSERLLLDLALAVMGLYLVVLSWLSPLLLALGGVQVLLVYRALNVPVLRRLTELDPKTGLFNARYFNQEFERELRRAGRLGHEFSVLMADMDLLRAINNTHGHLAGDVVLEGLARAIKSSVRGYDVAARVGGEEFAILLPETGQDEAVVVAERIRRTFAAAEFKHPAGAGAVRASVSLGVATYPRDGDTFVSLMDRADIAVHWAKLDGRNRWVLASSRGDRPDSAVRPPSFASAPITEDDLTADPALTQLPATVPDEPVNSMEAGAMRPSSVQLRPWLAVFEAAVASCGLAALWPLFAWLSLPESDLWMLLSISALAGAAAAIRFEIPAPNRAIPANRVVLLMGAYLAGAAGAGMAVLAHTITLVALRRDSGRSILFEFGALSCSAIAIVVVLGEFGRSPMASFPAVILVESIALGAVNFLVVSLLNGWRVQLQEGSSLVTVWDRDDKPLLPANLMFGPWAMVAAAAYLQLGVIGAAGTLVPAVVFLYAHRNHIKLANSQVAELHDTNVRLSQASQTTQEALHELQRNYESVLDVLTSVLEARDAETQGHCRRVVEYSRAMAERLGLDAEEVAHICQGALLHDVGKIGVPDFVLHKPGHLDGNEWSIMKRHPSMGFGMIRSVGFLQHAAQVVLHHHEHFDGTGYPTHQRGSEIPLGARIFAVADAFDAMIVGRPYRPALPPERAVAEICRYSGTQFDPATVKAFMEWWEDLSPEGRRLYTQLPQLQARSLQATWASSPAPEVTNIGGR